MTAASEEQTGPASIEAARRRLSDGGLDSVSMDVAGQEQEIAVLDLPRTSDTIAERMAGIAGLAAVLKDAGFRYVALDITNATVADGNEEQGSHEQVPTQDRKGK